MLRFKRMILSFGVLLTCWTTPCSGADCPRNSAEAKKPHVKQPLIGLDAYLQKAIKRWRIPGLAIAVVKDGRVVYVRGYGVRKLGSAAGVDEHTVFSIASCTKAFAAASVAILVDEGKLRWDDKVVKHLPNFRLANDYITRETTIRDLLSHRVGVQAADLLHRRGDFGPKQIMKRLRFLRPVASFRAQMTYSNLLYGVVGEIVEKVTKKPWRQFVRQRIFSPLEMSRTSVLRPKETPKANIATQHWMTGKGIQPYQMGSRFQNVAPAGAVHSSAADMARWVTCLLGEGTFNKKKLLTPDRIHQMHSMQIPMPTARSKSVYAAKFLGYGLGWNVLEYRGRKLIHHAGSSVAIVALMPDEEVGIVILTNLEHTVLVYKLMYDILDAYLVGPEVAWSIKNWPSWLDPNDEYKHERRALQKLQSKKKHGTKPALPLAAYAGKYRCNLLGEVRVVRRDKKLLLQFGPNLAADLIHWHDDAFLTQWHAPFELLMLTFKTTSEQRVASFSLRFVASKEPLPRFIRVRQK